MTRVFISYRRQPSAMLATLLARELTARNIDVYVDTQQLDSAGAFPDRLKDGIEACDVFVCLVGHSTFESEWVLEEIKTALHYSKPMIPVFQESYQSGEAAPDAIVKQLLDYDGILIFDVKNVYIDQSIDVLARMIENTASQMQKSSVATTTPNPNINLTDLAGETLGQYQLEHLLGMGGMGAVYKATQVSLNRSVAIKVLSPALAADAGYAERFSREAQIAAALEHPHIVPVYDYGSANGLSYVVMRYLAGGSLADWMERAERPTISETVTIIQRLALALDYAHSQGIVHRDIKASNVMFDEHGTPILVDFGIAKLIGATSALTGTGVMMGTPLYMAPEQWRSEGITAETDQYALGVLTYGLITGHMPFAATTPFALMQQHLNEAPPPTTTYRSDLPTELQNVLDRALAKDPSDRFPSVQTFADALTTAAESSSSPDAPSVSSPPPDTQPTLHSEPTRSEPLPITPEAFPLKTEARTLPIMALSAAAIVVLGLIVVGIIGTRPGGFLVAVAPTETATESPPTPTVTELPTTQSPIVVPSQTVVPTPSPTPIPPPNTATATNTSQPDATSTDTPSVTPSPIIVPTSLPANALFIYDDAAFTVHNQSNDILSLEGLIFRSANGTWEAIGWGESLYTSLPANACLRLRDMAVGNREPPAICRELYGLQLVGPSVQFWRNVEAFEVTRSGTVVATCSTAATTCPVYIPPIE